MEVDARLQADKETKNLYQGMIKNMMNEVNAVKEQTETTVTKLTKDVKDTA